MKRDIKPVILAFSLIYVIFLMVMLFLDKLRGMDGVSLGVLSCMTFLLGGPIAYFFVNASDAKFDLTTPWGKVTLLGGYAIGAVAAVIIWMAPQREWIRNLTLDNVLRDIRAADIEVEKVSAAGELKVIRPLTDEGPFEFVCYYPTSTISSIEVRITYIANAVEGPKRIVKSIPRVGDTVAMIPLE